MLITTFHGEQIKYAVSELFTHLFNSIISLICQISSLCYWKKKNVIILHCVFCKNVFAFVMYKCHLETGLQIHWEILKLIRAASPGLLLLSFGCVAYTFFSGSQGEEMAIILGSVFFFNTFNIKTSLLSNVIIFVQSCTSKKMEERIFMWNSWDVHRERTERQQQSCMRNYWKSGMKKQLCEGGET